MEDIDSSRRAAVRACIDDAKAIAAGREPDRAALEAIRDRLMALAARRGLFPCARFPVLRERGDDASSVYLLQEDDDRSWALFAVAELRGNESPPHDHTTWAVLAGVEGEETNRFYERLDDGSVEGRAEIRETGRAAVRPGTGIALMPDDIHSIHCLTGAPTLVLHLYGRSIADLPGRKMFDMRDGSCRTFPARPDILRA